MAERGRPRGFDRARALRQAMEVFWEHGYEGASIQRLTAVMGINAPSLYAAFGCKENLFREAVALYEERERVPTPEGGSVRDAVAGLLRNAAVAYTEPGKPHGCFVVLGATTYTPKTEGIRDYLAQRRRLSIARLVDRLDHAVTDGELPRGTDTAALAGYIATVMNGMSTLARDGSGRAELLGVADAAMAAWDHLTGGEAGQAGRPVSFADR